MQLRRMRCSTGSAPARRHWCSVRGIGHCPGGCKAAPCGVLSRANMPAYWRSLRPCLACFSRARISTVLPGRSTSASEAALAVARTHACREGEAPTARGTTADAHRPQRNPRSGEIALSPLRGVPLIAREPQVLARDLDAPAAGEGGGVPAADARDLDDVAGVRGVDELTAADVDADVARTGEEHEITGLQVVDSDRRAHPELSVRAVR